VASRKPWKVLIEALGSADEVVAADAARLLGELGDRRAVPALCDYVLQSRFYCKTAGIDALGRLGDRAAVPVLQKLLREPNVDDDWFWYCRRAVLASTAVALLSLGDESGVPLLVEMADKDDDVFFCWYAPAILRLTADSPAVRDLKSRLTAAAIVGVNPKKTRHTEPGLITIKLEALGLVRTPEACEAIKSLLGFHSRYVRGQAALSLMEAACHDGHEQLIAALADGDATDFVRIKASLALALTGHKERAAFIAAAAGRVDDWFDRATALEALGILGDDAYTAEIEAQLDHAEPYVRQCALEALERVGAPSAVAAAQRALKDKNERVRLQAAKLLAAAAAKETSQ